MKEESQYCLSRLWHLALPYALKRFIVPICTYNIGVNSISVWKNLYDLIYLLLFAMIICIINKTNTKEICHGH